MLDLDMRIYTLIIRIRRIRISRVCLDRQEELKQERDFVPRRRGAGPVLKKPMKAESEEEEGFRELEAARSS